MGDEELKQLWELFLPLLKESPLFLIAVIIMTVEGKGFSKTIKQSQLYKPPLELIQDVSF